MIHGKNKQFYNLFMKYRAFLMQPSLTYPAEGSYIQIIKNKNKENYDGHRLFRSDPSFFCPQLGAYQVL
jgi:hypothetical protein